MMAWREILARIFEGLKREEDVSPEWLVNPGTRRHLKLDVFYPEIGIAIRFVGLQGKGHKSISDWELMEEEQRDQIRAELCRSNGVFLVLIPVASDRPGETLRALSAALGQASRSMAQGSRPLADKRRLMPVLAEARQRCEEIIQRVRTPDDLALYAELWRDREAAMVIALQNQPAAQPRKKREPPRFVEGMAVTHTAFGPGTVIAITPEGNDARITVQFVTAGVRTFLASLAADKLTPA
jgi:hypothetical protein